MWENGLFLFTFFFLFVKKSTNLWNTDLKLDITWCIYASVSGLTRLCPAYLICLSRINIACRFILFLLCSFVLLSFAVRYAPTTSWLIACMLDNQRTRAWAHGLLAGLKRKSQQAETTVEQVKQHLLTPRNIVHTKSPGTQITINRKAQFLFSVMSCADTFIACHCLSRKNMVDYSTSLLDYMSIASAAQTFEMSTTLPSN